MTQVTIDNTPISKQLAKGESETVPAGETWKVTIVSSIEDSDATSADPIVVSINGINAISQRGTNATGYEIVLKENDTIKVENSENSSTGIHISGFVVKS